MLGVQAENTGDGMSKKFSAVGILMLSLGGISDLANASERHVTLDAFIDAFAGSAGTWNSAVAVELSTNPDLPSVALNNQQAALKHFFLFTTSRRRPTDLWQTY